MGKEKAEKNSRQKEIQSANSRSDWNSRGGPIHLVCADIK